MKLSREEVQHIATLARVGMAEEDLETFSTQLSSLLEYFGVLQQVDTTDVSPTSHSVDLHTVLREDQVEPSIPQEEVLRNAPQEKAGCFRVRAILE